MHTEIDWEIRLDDEKNATHVINIEICEYEELRRFGFEKQILSLSFPTSDRVEFINATANDEPCEWVSDSKEKEIIFSCSLHEIINKYAEDTTQKIKTTLTFLHSGAISELDDIFLYDFFCNARSLHGRTINVAISVPIQRRNAYRFQRILAKILKAKHVIGTYKIFFPKERETNLQVESRNPYPIIKYKSTTQGFPEVLFLFQNLLNFSSFTWYLLFFLTWIFGGATGSLLAFLIMGFFA